MNATRVAEITRRLADLGDVSTWRGDIDSMTGDLVLYLPPQFEAPMAIGNMEDSNQADHALMDFLGDAPHAIRELLEDNRAAYDLLDTILGDDPQLSNQQFTELLARWRALRNGQEANNAE